MEYVNERIEEAKEELRILEDEMFAIQRRYHVFEKQANELWSAPEHRRNKLLVPFVDLAGDDIWHRIFKTLEDGVNEHTYDKCKDIICDDDNGLSDRDRVKLLSAFVKGCPHIIAHKLRDELCVKSRECLVVNKRLNHLYTQANRAIESYQATASKTSSTQSACVQ